MDIHGDINLKDNELQQLLFQQELDFPVSAVVGSVVFKGNTLYMAVALNVADPIWIPLTNTINTYIHDQTASSSTWTVTHNLNVANPIVQVYDDNRALVVPTSVILTDSNELAITLSSAIAGRAIVMYGDEIPANGVGILEPSSGPDIGGGSYSGNSLSVVSQNDVPRDIFFSDDGTKMYFCGIRVPYAIFEYDLSVAWDLSTATYNSVVLDFTADGVLNPQAFFIGDGGTKLLIADGSNRNITSYTMSTPWDLSSATFDSLTFSTASEELTQVGLSFKSDGTKMYIVGNASLVFEYDLGTAWNVSTAVYNSNVTSVVAQGIGPTGLFIDSGGKRLFIMGVASNRTVYQYTMGTAWDITTLTYDGVSFDSVAQVDFPTGVYIGNSGASMYIIDSTTDAVYQYDL